MLTALLASPHGLKRRSGTIPPGEANRPLPEWRERCDALAHEDPRVIGTFHAYNVPEDSDAYGERICQNRRRTLAEARRVGTDVLVTVDDDVFPPDGTVTALLDLLEEDPHLAAANALCWTQGTDPLPVIYPRRNAFGGPLFEKRWTAVPLGEVCLVATLGFGCAALRLSAIAEIESPFEWEWRMPRFSLRPSTYGKPVGMDLLRGEDLRLGCELDRRGWTIVTDCRRIATHVWTDPWGLIRGNPAEADLDLHLPGWREKAARWSEASILRAAREAVTGAA